MTFLRRGASFKSDKYRVELGEFISPQVNSYGAGGSGGVGLYIYNNGFMDATGTKSAPEGVILNTFVNRKWKLSQSPASVYYVRATDNGSIDVPGGSGFGTWLQLNTTRSWTLSGSSNDYSADFIIEIAADSGGQRILDTVGVHFEVFVSG